MKEQDPQDFKSEAMPNEAYIRFSFKKLEDHIKSLQEKISVMDLEYDMQIEFLKKKLQSFEKRQINNATFSKMFKTFLVHKLGRKHAYPRTRAKATKTTRES